MRLANLRGRAALVVDGGYLDVAAASAGLFGPDLGDVYADWDHFLLWAHGALESELDIDIPVDAGSDDELDAVVPVPGQVLAVGLNYTAHAHEAGLPLPEVPLVFTKFPSAVAAPRGVLELPTDQVDWEVELAVVIGRTARRVARDEAWTYVAGLTAAQDYSARDVQLLGGAKPQFSLGKSFEGFLPLGPVLVTPEEYDDPDAIGVETRVNGHTVQKSNTSDLIFSIPQLVSYLSHIVTLRPGDVILTGTPSGVGLGMTPPRYLTDGDEVTTHIDGIGELHQACRAPEVAFDPAAILG
ncbi:fumarylacetoacetate hydrolase family protein [Nocardioides humilatus]|uniref:Fumarylacetoacetate hydrolase family protein n=1 Tax=Nocardioides humilatus TaxID=2607660 RepID=A0A5B1LMN5_9ACTN|nr:fumarylacetoacetate hydrolase family protein [Nocardioides humilatus]KAA1421803.1 fumarylacetoacetate hydrolase family protein [Nocardioides humilatus]